MPSRWPLASRQACDLERVRGRTGYKTFWAEVVGTGAVTATVTIYGCRTIENANGVLVTTITLSDTTRGQDVATTSTAVYPYYYVDHQRHWNRRDGSRGGVY